MVWVCAGFQNIKNASKMRMLNTYKYIAICPGANG